MHLFSRLKLLIYLLLFIIGCEENNTNNISLDNIEVITSNYYETPFYYNFIGDVSFSIFNFLRISTLILKLI